MSGAVQIDTSFRELLSFPDGPLAQLAEQLTLNQLVEGSSPSRLTSFHTSKKLGARSRKSGLILDTSQLPKVRPELRRANG